MPLKLKISKFKSWDREVTLVSRLVFFKLKALFLFNKGSFNSFHLFVFKKSFGDEQGNCSGYWFWFSVLDCLYIVRWSAYCRFWWERKSIVIFLKQIDLLYSIDSCIYIRDNEIVIGSSAQQLAQTYPENVISHPLHYLDKRSCKNNCNSKLVNVVFLVDE